MKRNIDLIKAMRTFLVVVDHQSFTAASQTLNLVTSAVSRQVSDLEKHFDCQLLYRTTRAMHLTAEGQFYLEQFKDVLERLDSLEMLTSERQQKVTGHLRMTTPINIGRLGIQKKVSDFLSLHPDVTLSWMLVNRFVNLVEEGVDLAIRVGDLPDSSLIARQFTTLSVHFVASPDYLLQHGTPKHPEELASHQCVLDSSIRTPRRWRYNTNKGEQQVSVQGTIEVNQGGLVAEFAAAGHGVALLPEFLVQEYVDRGELVHILSEYQLPKVPVSLVYPANRMASPALKSLVDYLLEYRPKDKG